MKIDLLPITIRELTNGYRDDGEGGVVGYGGALDVRPPYQREFVYTGKQRDAVIDTAIKGFPLNVMYWAVRGDGRFEIIDGQQRTISLAQYVTGDFSYTGRYFHNLQKDEKNRFLNYGLTVYLCDGTDSEKLDWFRIVNIAGEKLYEQELRNAVYHGPWLADAKTYFSRNNCPAYGLASDYLTGSPIRQDYLETAIKWISTGDIEGYMSQHQPDLDADPLWAYFRAVITWVETNFKKTTDRKKYMKHVDWGTLYRDHKNDRLDPDAIEAETEKLMLDEEVENKKGIYAYILTRGEHYLNLRSFSDAFKQKAYNRQESICPLCKKAFDFDQMQGDHIIPWSKGGKTNDEANCQMLCRPCNARKGAR